MKRLDLSAYARDPVAFIDRFVTRNERGEPFRLRDHQREFLRIAFAFDDDGRLPFDDIVFGDLKKSGKTTLNAAVTLWWAFTQEAPNELKCVANDLEQATARVFTTICGLLKFNAELGASATIKSGSISFSNGSVIQALANDYAGEAGANQGWSSFTELWAVTSEAGRRLWEELTPVPTRRNSLRFTDTTAGFEGESELLWSVFLLVVDRAEHPQGQGERLHPTLPIYVNRAARIVGWWNHEPRMPWQTAEYYAAQKRTLRPSTYLRLHENRWTTGVSTFITPELWDPCVEASHRPILKSTAPVYVGVDAATKNDLAAVVAVRWISEGRLELVAHRVWRPTPSQPIDLESTVEAFLRDLHRRMRIGCVLADPYQLVRSIATLKAAGLPIEEFAQTTAGTTLMGSTLFDLLRGRNIRLYPDPDLRAQALNTVAVESPRGWRVAKEKASKKIDAIVALSLACVAAIQHPAPKKITSATWGRSTPSNEVSYPLPPSRWAEVGISAPRGIPTHSRGDEHAAAIIRGDVPFAKAVDERRRTLEMLNMIGRFR